MKRNSRVAAALKLTPLVFILGTAAGLSAIIWGEWQEGNHSPVYGLGIAALGFPCHWIWSRSRKRDAGLA